MSRSKITRSLRLGLCQNAAHLLPSQNLFILWPKVLRNLQRPGWILDEKLLLDCFIEDGLEVRACLLDPILAIRLRQVVDMRLQFKLVDRFDGPGTELPDQIDLNLS
jgi:hypothetical protein